MATTFGKELRKLRIDKDETIYVMAKKLGLSISYLFVIELGSCIIPNGMIDKIIEKYHLNKERADIIRQAESELLNKSDTNLVLVRHKYKINASGDACS